MGGLGFLALLILAVLVASSAQMLNGYKSAATTTVTLVIVASIVSLGFANLAFNGSSKTFAYGAFFSQGFEKIARRLFIGISLLASLALCCLFFVVLQKGVAIERGRAGFPGFTEEWQLLTIVGVQTAVLAITSAGASTAFSVPLLAFGRGGGARSFHWSVIVWYLAVGASAAYLTLLALVGLGQPLVQIVFLVAVLYSFVVRTGARRVRINEVHREVANGLTSAYVGLSSFVLPGEVKGAARRPLTELLFLQDLLRSNVTGGVLGMDREDRCQIELLTIVDYLVLRLCGREIGAPLRARSRFFAKHLGDVCDVCLAFKAMAFINDLNEQAQGHGVLKKMKRMEIRALSRTF